MVPLASAWGEVAGTISSLLRLMRCVRIRWAEHLAHVIGEEINAYRIIDVDWTVIPKYKLKESDGMEWARYPSSG